MNFPKSKLLLGSHAILWQLRAGTQHSALQGGPPGSLEDTDMMVAAIAQGWEHPFVRALTVAQLVSRNIQN